MGVIYREGNVIGNSRSSSVSAANGLWNLYELENRRRNNIWPEQIVRSSLVLSVDAGIIESYSGSGSTWADISGNEYSTSLVGSPDYSTINGGYFVFNGTNHSAVSDGANITTNNFSFDFWAKPTATITVNTQATSGTTGLAGQRYVLGPGQAGSNGGAGVSLGTNGVSVYEHGASYLSPLLSHGVAISSTLFSHMVIVYTNKQPSLYINGIFIKTGLTSLKTNVLYNNAQFIGGTYGLFAGHVANIKVYSKSLTATEVTQNFNALRNRYGI